MPVVCGYRKETVGEDTIYLGWELSCGFLWLWNALPALQGRGGAAQALAAAHGFLLLLELVSLSAGALMWFRYLLADFCFLTCPPLSAV